MLTRVRAALKAFNDPELIRLGEEYRPIAEIVCDRGPEDYVLLTANFVTLVGGRVLALPTVTFLNAHQSRAIRAYINGGY